MKKHTIREQHEKRQAHGAPHENEQDHSITLHFVCSQCGCPEIFAVAPGVETENRLGITLLRGRADRAWCRKCWSARFTSPP